MENDGKMMEIICLKIVYHSGAVSPLKSMKNCHLEDIYPFSDKLTWKKDEKCVRQRGGDTLLFG